MQKLEKKTKYWHLREDSSEDKRSSLLLVAWFLLWPAAAYFLAYLVMILLAKMLFFVHHPTALWLFSASDNVGSAVSSALMTAIWLALLFGVLWLRKKKYPFHFLGVKGLPKWSDIGWAIVVFVGFSVVAGIVVAIVKALFPSFDMDQEQQIGFQSSVGMAAWQYIAAFVCLVVIAPVVEEFIFRGFMYSNIRRFLGWIPAVVLTSLVFAALHLQLGAASPQVNVAIIVFFLSVGLCLLREFTGSIWASLLLHMIKNAIAFVVLFIVPMLAIVSQ